MLKLYSFPPRGKDVRGLAQFREANLCLTPLLFIVFLFAAGFFIAPHNAHALVAETVPEAGGFLEALPANHLFEVLKKSTTSPRRDAADASAFSGIVKIGGATAAANSALLIGHAAGGAGDGENMKTQAARHGLTVYVPEYVVNGYFPGIVWETGSDNAKKPKLGIWGQMSGAGSKMFFGTSNNYSTGITNTAMTIDQGGNVGIKKTDPGATLDVVGTIRAQTAPGNVPYYRSISTNHGSTWGFGTQDDDSFAFWRAPGGGSWSELMRINSSGNVGIGTTNTANGKLTINGGDNLLRLENDANDGNPLLRFRTKDSAGRFFHADIRAKATDEGRGETGYLQFNVPWNSSPRMVIKDSGNVGIGTTSPKQMLDVNYGSDNTLKGIAASATNTGTVGLTLNNTNTSYASGILFNVGDANRALIKASNNKSITITTLAPDNKNWNTGMVVDMGGNVGIGTTNPGANLDINDIGDADNNRSKLKVGNSNPALNATVNLIAHDGENILGVWDDNNLAVPRFLVTRAGNVGIGTTRPEGKLDVDGFLKAGGWVEDKNLLVVMAGSKAFPSSNNGAYWAAPMIYRSIRFPDNGRGTFPDNEYGELMLQGTSHGNGYNRGISFITTPNDTTGPAIRMRINPDGNVYIAGALTAASVSMDTINVGCWASRCWSDANGIIGFPGFGVRHGSLAFYPSSNAFAFIDSSAKSPAGDYGPLNLDRIFNDFWVGSAVVKGNIYVPYGAIGFNSPTTAGTGGIAASDFGYIYGEHDKDSEVSRMIFSLGDNAVNDNQDKFVFRTNNWNSGNRNAMTINGNQILMSPTGSVSITSPSNDMLRIQNDSNEEADIRYLTGSGNWEVGTNNQGNGSNNNQFYIYDGSPNVSQLYAFTVQQGTGNVGIGTRRPGVKLDVYDSSATAGDRLFVGSAADNNGEYTGIRILNSGIDNAAIRSFLQTGSNPNSRLGIFVGDNVGNALLERLSILANGNVGIGTTSPSQDAKLDVRGRTYLGGSDSSRMIKFTDSWTGYPDQTNGAEISNDTAGYKTLMIVGNKSAGGARSVSVWDLLNVNGSLNVNGNGYFSNAVGIGGSPGNFRLALYGEYANRSFGQPNTAGIYTQASVGNALMAVGNGPYPPIFANSTYAPGTNAILAVNGDSSRNGAFFTPTIYAWNRSWDASRGQYGRAAEFWGTVCINGDCRYGWGSTSGGGSSSSAPTGWQLTGSSIHTFNDTVNVGIGTSSPSAKLEIVAPTSYPAMKIATNNSYEIQFTGTAGANIFSLSTPLYILAGPGQTLRLGSNNINDQMVLNNGNVGIGTDRPEGKLEVSALGGFVDGVQGIVEPFNGVGNVPILARVATDSTAFGIVNRWDYAAFAINIEGSAYSPNQRGIVSFFDRYNGSWNRALVLKNGNVGIGDTITPSAKLHVISGGNAEQSEWWGGHPLQIWDGNDRNRQSMQIGVDSNRKVAYIQSVQMYCCASNLLLNARGGNVGIGGKFLNVSTPPMFRLDVDGSINVAFAENTKKLALNNDSFGMDVAELFDAEQEVEEGDVLVVSSEGKKVKRSSEKYQPGLMGVVSSAPAVLFEGSELKLAPDPARFTKGTKPPVTLAGRVQVKATNENGSIQPGDYLTSSSVQGVAMKATEPGPTIGIALESFNSVAGTIVVFVNIGENNVGTLVDEVKKIKDANDTIQKRLDRLEKGYRKTYW